MSHFTIRSSLRHENQKIRHENEMLKATEPAPYVQELQIFRITKKHTTKSSETIPLIKSQRYH
jgi:hypothetical protein